MEERKIYCNENLTVVKSDHPNFTVGFKMTEEKIKLVVNKNYRVIIFKQTKS